MTILGNDDKSAGTYVAVKYNWDTRKALQALQERISVPNPVEPSEFHTTVVYSRKSIAWDPELKLEVEAKPKGFQCWDTHDKKKCLVLLIDCPFLHERWQEAMDKGATYDFDDYRPHISLSYDIGEDFDAKSIEVPDFPMVITHEYVKKIND